MGELSTHKQVVVRDLLSNRRAGPRRLSNLSVLIRAGIAAGLRPETEERSVRAMAGEQQETSIYTYVVDVPATRAKLMEAIVSRMCA